MNKQRQQATATEAPPVISDKTDYITGQPYDELAGRPADRIHSNEPAKDLDIKSIIRILQAAGIRTTRKELLAQVRKHGVGKLVSYLIKRGRYRHVANLAARQPDERSQMLKHYLSQINYNEDMRDWFLRCLATDENFGKMAERNDSEDDRKALVWKTILRR